MNASMQTIGEVLDSIGGIPAYFSRNHSDLNKMNCWKMTYKDRLEIAAFYREINEYRDIFEINWCEMLSPIEFPIWEELRVLGLPFKPQFPVLKYFVDFADDKKRIAIEADGKGYHSDDSARDKAMSEVGWEVYRVTGSECVRSTLSLGEISEYIYYEGLSELEAFRMRENFYLNTSDGLCHAISLIKYSGKKPSFDDEVALAHRTLSAHLAT